MPIDLAELIEQRRADKFQLFERHLNAQLVRILRALDCAVDYVRATGPHLFDADGNRYLDLLSGFGVFALGRNHPTVTGALEQVLRGQLAGLVQLDAPLLAGLLAERLTGYMPWLLPDLWLARGRRHERLAGRDDDQRRQPRRSERLQAAVRLLHEPGARLGLRRPGAAELPQDAADAHRR
jgi:hypothetical protein